MLKLITGAFIGTYLGITLMCMFQINKSKKRNLTDVIDKYFRD